MELQVFQSRDIFMLLIYINFLFFFSLIRNCKAQMKNRVHIDSEAYTANIRLPSKWDTISTLKESSNLKLFSK